MDALQAIFFDIGDTLAVPHLDAAGRLASLQPLHGVLDVLVTLRDRGFRLGIISNTGDETIGSMRAVLEHAHLYAFFEPELLIYSSVVEKEKDSPEIFSLACARAGLAPGRCMFVGERAVERGFASDAHMRVAATVAEVSNLQLI